MNQLSKQQIEQFINLGYIKIENAFSKEIADECRSILWKTIQLDPNNPATWIKPVIRVNEMNSKPFEMAANTPVLLESFKQLVADNWWARKTMGTFPIRFPVVDKPAGDTGWHVDAGFPGDDAADFFTWRININSKGRALLMLFLFSDVAENDAPTIIREGSHLDVTKLLEPAGEEGLSFMELAHQLDNLPKRKETIATGAAGTVYLCHPFIAHAAQDHCGRNPKFMAQPALLAKRDFNIHQPEELCCPVEKAIIKGLEK